MTQTKRPPENPERFKVRAWLRSNGFNVCECVKNIDGANVKFWWLAAAERKRLAAMLNQQVGGK